MKKETKIIAKVRGSLPNQRRITIPSDDKTLENGDIVEIKKVEVK